MTTTFSIEEWKKIRKKNLSYLEEGVTTLAPFGGLTTNAIAHLREDWIRWRDDVVLVTVPATDSCNSYKLEGGTWGEVPTITERDSPCNYCKKAGETDGFELLKNDFGRTDGARSYTAILHREIAAPAVDFLTTTFRTYGRSEVGATPNGVADAAKNAAGGTEFPEHTPAKLIRTGVIVYDYYGLDNDEIADLLPFAPATIETILNEAGESHWECKATTEFLRAVKRMEPVEVQALADEINKSLPATRKRLNNYRERDKVTRSNDDNLYDYTNPTTWSTTDEWNTPFKCSDCGYECWSLNALTSHKNMEH